MQVNSRLSVHADAFGGTAAGHGAQPWRRAQSPRFVTAMLSTLGDVEGLWRTLEMTGSATCFQSFDVFSAWACNVAPVHGAEWFVVAVLDQDSLRPLMLLPLTRVLENGLRVIEAADLGVCDFNAPLVHRRFAPSQSEMATIWKEIVALLPEADLIRITKMPEEIGGTPNPLLLLDASHKLKLANFKTPLMSMGKPWSPELLSEKLREDLSARRRKLSKRGKLEFRIAQTQDEARRYFEAMVNQRASRFAAMGRTDVLACPAHRNFYWSLIDPASPNSAAVIQALLIDGEAIATGYGFQSPDSFSMIFPTFKAEGWRNYSPGLQLFIESMTWATERGFAYYDFTIGGESFKLDLGAREYPLYEHLQPLTLKACPLVLRERLKSTVRAHPRLMTIAQWAIASTLAVSEGLRHASQS